MSYHQDPRDQYYNNQSGYQEEYAGGYQQGQLARNYQDPRDQYYNNQYQGEYADGYQQGQFTNDDYRPPNNNYYPTPNSGGKAADDDDNVSVNSSVYSQPSVVGNVGNMSSNNARYYQEQYLETTEPRRQSLQFNEYDYPPSPFADSTNTHNSTTGLTTQQGVPINEKNYIEENHYHNSSQNTQPQFDAYKDFNNNIRSDETYDEESRHDTLTGSDGANDPNSYAFQSNGKGNRQSTSGEHYVVNPKKGRRCAFCSRKICVIITFTILALLAVGMYFVWPRIPKVQFLESAPVGDPEITIKPAPFVKLDMELKFEFDSSENWLPYKFNSLNVDVFDAANQNDRAIGAGNIKDMSIPGRAKTIVSIPISIKYEGSAPNDPVLQDFIGGCTKPQGNEQKSFLNLRVEMKMFIKGLDWVHKPTVPIPILNFKCPFDAIRPSPDAEQPAPPAGQPAPAPVPAPTTPTPPPAAPTPPPAAPAPPPAAPAPPAVPAPPPADPPAEPPAEPAPEAPGDGGAGGGGAGDGGAGDGGDGV